MVQRFYKIIVAFLLGVYGLPVSAQQPTSKPVPGPLQTKNKQPLISDFVDQKNSVSIKLLTSNEQTGWPVLDVNKKLVPVSISGNFYTRHFGFFCKKELQLEKMVRIPLRFRLGSVDYCRHMEKSSK